jgi:hypothetical protein
LYFCHNLMRYKRQWLAQELAVLAKKWTTIFVCRLTKLNAKLKNHEKPALILATKRTKIWHSTPSVNLKLQEIASAMNILTNLAKQWIRWPSQVFISKLHFSPYKPVLWGWVRHVLISNRSISLDQIYLVYRIYDRMKT